MRYVQAVWQADGSAPCRIFAQGVVHVQHHVHMGAAAEDFSRVPAASPLGRRAEIGLMSCSFACASLPLLPEIRFCRRRRNFFVVMCVPPAAYSPLCRVSVRGDAVQDNAGETINHKFGSYGVRSESPTRVPVEQVYERTTQHRQVAEALAAGGKPASRPAPAPPCSVAACAPRLDG